MTSIMSEFESGMELHDLQEDADFARRHLHMRNSLRQVEALRRLARTFANTPENILQELVDIAMELCGADSTGISLEEENAIGESVFRWVATAGKFSQFANGGTPRFYSPCGTCLDRGAAQLFRVTQPYYDTLGIEAEPVTDGMLIPWQTGDVRGTIWVVAHESTEAFDIEDYRVLECLADFSAIAVRHLNDQRLLLDQATVTATAALANELAHQINNPLQSLTNTVYLLAEGGEAAPVYAEQATAELAILSSLVKRLLSRTSD